MATRIAAAKEFITASSKSLIVGEEGKSSVRLNLTITEAAGLPPGIRVAHKTGDITAVSHDAAIVYPPGRQPYVLVVLTRGITDGAKSAKLIADISSMVFSHNAAAHALHANPLSSN